MRKIFAAAAALSLAATAGIAYADVVEMPAGEGPAVTTGLPRKGSTMQEVQRQFGSPQLRHAPAGGDSPKHPPITRWDYQGFAVYFEHNHVVDAVVPGAPTPVYHADQLSPAG